MELKDLTPELQEKVRRCKTPEDILALSREEGYELSDEEVEGISGGNWSCWTVCDDYGPSYCTGNEPFPR